VAHRRGRSAGAANGQRSDAGLVHRPVDRHQLHGAPTTLKATTTPGAGLLGAMITFSRKRKLEVVDLARCAEQNGKPYRAMVGSFRTR
jgi:hypothetical protein